MCGIDMSQECNMIVMDNDECAFILSFDMDFSQDYFVQFIPQMPFHLKNGYNIFDEQTESLLYSPSVCPKSMKFGLRSVQDT